MGWAFTTVLLHFKGFLFPFLSFFKDFWPARWPSEYRCSLCELDLSQGWNGLQTAFLTVPGNSTSQRINYPALTSCPRMFLRTYSYRYCVGLRVWGREPLLPHKAWHLLRLVRLAESLLSYCDMFCTQSLCRIAETRGGMGLLTVVLVLKSFTSGDWVLSKSWV